MSETFESIGKDLSSDFSSLKKDVAKLTSLVADLARSHRDNAKENVSGLMDRARDTYGDKSDMLSSKASDVSKKVREASGSLSDQVEHNPLAALSLAFISGLVIGMISRSVR